MITQREALPWLAGAFVLLFCAGVVCLPREAVAQIAGQNVAQVFGLRASPRSQAAQQRLRPVLEQDLRERGLPWGAPIFIRIFKEESELEVWVAGDDGFVLFRSYPICFWSGELGPSSPRATCRLRKASTSSGPGV